MYLDTHVHSICTLISARTSLHVSILLFEHGHTVVKSQSFPPLESQSHLTVSVYTLNNTVHKETEEDPLADEEQMVLLGYHSVTKYGHVRADIKVHIL